jgi:HD superfamily phosphohydrolase
VSYSETLNNKRKIVNDPVYGFISIPGGYFFDLIEHPYFQRLRRIKQLSLTHLVYPGALHTRFHHVLGAMHLMDKALLTLKRKGVEITPEEEKAVLTAILLHDIGHGPFSHTLEHTLIQGVTHEEISAAFMQALSKEFGEELLRALNVFRNDYHKPFLHQLVSSQLDMDRLDYLNRDSFYTGVSEGRIGSDRIIEMLNVHNGQLVVEEKGIYSIEKFITSRRLMYWQVYLHKTVVGAEFMLIRILERAKELTQQGEQLFASPALSFFLNHTIDKSSFENNPEVLRNFAQLDDYDIMGAIKVWMHHPDRVLSLLSEKLVNRRLLKVEVSREPFGPDRIELEKQLAADLLGITVEEATYFVYTNILTNNAYTSDKQNINLLMKNGEVIDLPKASDNLNISALSTPVKKYALCYPVKH